LKFYSSIRLDIRRIQSIKEGDRVVGSRTRAKVVKNKVASPFREAEFDILYGEGVSREGDLIDLGVDQGLLEKSGTWISYGGERLGQGRDNARLFLKEHIDIRNKVESALRKKMGIPSPNAANGTPAPAAQAEKPATHPAAQAAAAGASANKPRPTK
jgi:recombination protein RecA